MSANEIVLTRAYKAAKAYSSEVIDMSETLTFTGTAEEAHLLGQVLSEKVKLQVWSDALDLGILPIEDIEVYVTVALNNVERVKESIGSVEISEENQTLVVSNILIVDQLITFIQTKLQNH